MALSILSGQTSNYHSVTFVAAVPFMELPATIEPTFLVTPIRGQMA